jgi:hypothetical protein
LNNLGLLKHKYKNTERERVPKLLRIGKPIFNVNIKYKISTIESTAKKIANKLTNLASLVASDI